MITKGDFCIFILSHGRAENVITAKTLRKIGYSGEMYIVIDDQDSQTEKYKEIFGKSVIVFNKQKYINSTDSGDNFPEYRSVLYARNACFDIARNLGKRYFMEFDDDYGRFEFTFNKEFCFSHTGIKNNFDKIIKCLLTYYESIPAKSIAIAQAGDFIGGSGGLNPYVLKGPMLLRKCMNTFICSVDRPFKFFAKMNDDVTTYVNLGSKGELFFTATNLSINQVQTQESEGGLTDIYLSSGTYVKSFYTVMFNPSSVKVSLLQSKYKRLHHLISWEHTVPKILREEFSSKK